MAQQEAFHLFLKMCLAINLAFNRNQLLCIIMYSCLRNNVGLLITLFTGKCSKIIAILTRGKLFRPHMNNTINKFLQNSIKTNRSSNNN
jgi:hypothetical protein